MQRCVVVVVIIGGRWWCCNREDVGGIGEEEETLYSFFIFIFFCINSLIIIFIICNFTNTYVAFIFILKQKLHTWRLSNLIEVSRVHWLDQNWTSWQKVERRLNLSVDLLLFSIRRRNHNFVPNYKTLIRFVVVFNKTSKLDQSTKSAN